MRPPPLLLGATLLFWGWQTEFLLPGALLGVLLESALVFKARWDLSDEDFRRVWQFCTLLVLAAGLYAFNANEGPSSYAGLFQDANLVAQRNASVSSARTALSVLRWLPMIYFPALFAQAYSTRQGVPLSGAEEFFVSERVAGEKPRGVWPGRAAHQRRVGFLSHGGSTPAPGERHQRFLPLDRRLLRRSRTGAPA